jgi:Na+-transporting NADH:ubiquinone oxidoreductase subunit B
MIGKEVFGGTGMNIFNPALTARAFLFFAYPAAMSGDVSVWVAEPLFYETTGLVDGITAATPLGLGSQSMGGEFSNQYSFMELFLGSVPGSIGETSALCAIIGAIILIITGIGSYKTMIGCVLGALVTGTLFTAFSTEAQADLLRLPAHYHLVMGGFAFGAVFMATDPVSSPATGAGKWIYGILIGVIVVLIRNINPAYPEGMMLAILFCNLFAPLIDHYIVENRIQKRLARA